MEVDFIFILLVVILSVSFIAERWLEILNLRAMAPQMPEKLKGIYEEKEYGRFQNYKREQDRLGMWSSGLSFVILMGLLLTGGLGKYNAWIVSFTDSGIGQVLLFMLGVGFVMEWIELPFHWYATFHIEEKYGFNKTTRKTFWLDTVKGWLLSLLFGGLVLTAIVWFYGWAGNYFWLYAWGMIAFVSVLVSLFYSQWIVPLFNKQTPLEAGSLRDRIEAFAERNSFKLDRIYVIDGSRRSTKANAYFAGWGAKRRIVLYDTLIAELTEEEIVAVLAHEIGHYKKRHTLQFMAASVLQTGLLFWLFSLVISRPELSMALGADRGYFQLGLVAFAILYSPVSTLLGIGMNAWSRKNEYEADAYAATVANRDALITGLKKISVKALSNLTPHPLYEFVYYSHPSLLKRVAAIEEKKSQE